MSFIIMHNQITAGSEQSNPEPLAPSLAVKGDPLIRTLKKESSNGLVNGSPTKLSRESTSRGTFFFFLVPFSFEIV